MLDDASEYHMQAKGAASFNSSVQQIPGHPPTARHQPFRAAQLAEERGHLILGEHDRQAHRALRTRHAVQPRELNPEDLPVEKQQRRERLVLRRRGHVALDREVIEKRSHLGRAHVARVPLAGEKDKATDPVQVRFLGAQAVVPLAQRVAHLVEQPRGSNRTRSYRFRIKRLPHAQPPITVTGYPYSDADALIAGRVDPVPRGRRL